MSLLQVDRFGLFRVQRFKTQKECNAAGDYPPGYGYETNSSMRDIFQVDLKLIYDLDFMKNMKKEFGTEIPYDVLHTPVHLITYFVEHSQLDRLLAYANYGMRQGLTVTVENITLAENATENEPIKQWFDSDSLKGNIFSFNSPLSWNEELTKLDTLLTFCNSIVFSLRTRFMTFENMSDFYKSCYSYYSNTIEGKFNVDFNYERISPLLSGLEELRDFNLKNPESIIMPEIDWFYEFLAQGVFKLKESHNFSFLMTVRENLLNTYGVLDNPLEKKIDRHEQKKMSFSSEIFKRFPLKITGLSMIKDSCPELDSIMDWFEAEMLPSFETAIFEINTKLRTELEPLDLIVSKTSKNHK